MTSLDDLAAFAAVVAHGGFRGAATARGTSASRLSEAVRRVETRLGIRLLHRTTRSVTPTELGEQLYRQLSTALEDVNRALDLAKDAGSKATGRLRLNVPISVARLVLPSIVPGFIAAYPDIELEVVADDRLVDVLAEGFDAGIRYGERLEQDMVAIPIGPRTQRFAAAATSRYLDRCGRPKHPRDLLAHTCFRGRFPGSTPLRWEFARHREVVSVDVRGPLIVGLGGTAELAVDAALADGGVVYLFEDWLRPHIDRGALEPVLEAWWPSFPGPYLYFAGRRQLPTPLRAFVEHVKRASAAG